MCKVCVSGVVLLKVVSLYAALQTLWEIKETTALYLLHGAGLLSGEMPLTRRI